MPPTQSQPSVAPGVTRRTVISSALAAAGGAMAFPGSTDAAEQTDKTG